MEGIHSKQLVQLIHFLVALIRHYRAPIRLPQNVTVNLVVVQVSEPEQRAFCFPGEGSNSGPLSLSGYRNERDDS